MPPTQESRDRGSGAERIEAELLALHVLVHVRETPPRGPALTPGHPHDDQLRGLLCYFPLCSKLVATHLQVCED